MLEEAEFAQLDAQDRAELQELLERWRARKAAYRLFLALCGLSAALVFGVLVMPGALAAVANDAAVAPPTSDAP